MQSSNDPIAPGVVARTTLLLLAVGINALEYLFPRIPFLPWLKPGLANAVTIVWIVRWGAADALLFSVLRAWLTSFYFGFSLVSLLLSMSGGVLAAAGMGLLWELFGRKRWLGFVGLGVAGAALHNIGQLICVYFMLTATAAIWYQAPFMLVASIVFGTLSGLLGHALLPFIDREVQAEVFPLAGMTPARHGGIVRPAAGCAILAASVVIAIVNNVAAVCIAAAIATLLALVMAGGKIAAVFFPVTRFWLLFVFVAAMDLFFSYGKTVAGIPFITADGARAALLQCLRLWTWIELSSILTRLEFNRIVLQSAARRLPFGKQTFAAAVMSFELFPAFIDLLRGSMKINFREAVKNPRGIVDSTIKGMYSDIQKLIGGMRV
jgi:uncharacterized membrane protein